VKPIRYSNLDILRLFLAVEVVMLHALNIPRPGSFVPLIVPVPAFVALSGFLIPQSFSASRGWQDFAWRRFIRVYPALIASFALVLILGMGNRLVDTLMTYCTAGLIVGMTANGALWSLIVEEACYSWHVLSRLCKWWSLQTSIAGCVVFLGLFALTQSNVALRLILVTIACFFAGNILLFCKPKLDRSHYALWFVGLVASSALWMVVRGSLITGPLVAFMSICAVAFCYRAPQLPHFPDFSYGIYIYHVPILITLMRWHAQALMPLTLGTAICVAIGSWYLIEKPVLRLKNRPWKFPEKATKSEFVESGIT